MEPEGRRASLPGAEEGADRAARPTFSGAWIQRLLDAVPIGLWLTDASGRCTYLDDYWCRVLEAEHDALLDAGWAGFIHPDDREDAKQSFMNAVRGGAPYEASFRFVSASGKVSWILTRGRPLRSPQGVSGYIGAITDITDQKQTEAELRQAQKLHTIGELAGGIAHDLNNVLTAIGAGVQIGLDDSPRPSEAHAALRDTREAVERAGQLTRQMVSLSRKSSGGRPDRIDVNAVVAEASALLRHGIPRDVSLELSLGSPSPTVAADATQIVQAILNFGLNARDAMLQGGTLRISTSVEHVAKPDGGAAGAFARISVSDTGAGMSDEVVARAFDPFFTTKPEGEGTGLGLSIARRSAAENGGWVTLSSAVGSGTSVSLFLPCEAAGYEVRPASEQ